MTNKIPVVGKRYRTKIKYSKQFSRKESCLDLKANEIFLIKDFYFYNDILLLEIEHDHFNNVHTLDFKFFQDFCEEIPETSPEVKCLCEITKQLGEGSCEDCKRYNKELQDSSVTTISTQYESVNAVEEALVELKEFFRNPHAAGEKNSWNLYLDLKQKAQNLVNALEAEKKDSSGSSKNAGCEDVGDIKIKSLNLFLGDDAVNVPEEMIVAEVKKALKAMRGAPSNLDEGIKKQTIEEFLKEEKPASIWKSESELPDSYQHIILNNFGIVRVGRYQNGWIYIGSERFTAWNGYTLKEWCYLKDFLLQHSQMKADIEALKKFSKRFERNQ